MHQRINYAVDNTARNAAFLHSDDVSKDNKRSEDGNLRRGNQGRYFAQGESDNPSHNDGYYRTSQPMAVVRRTLSDAEAIQKFYRGYYPQAERTGY